MRNAQESRVNARTGTNILIALILPSSLSPFPGQSSSKMDAVNSLSVSEMPRYHFKLVRRPAEMRIWYKIWFERNLWLSARNREMVRALITSS